MIGRLILLSVNDWRDDLTNRQRILLRKFKIAFVMSRHTHHCARAIIHQDVVCDPDRQELAVERIDRQLAGVDSQLLFLDRRVFSFDRARGFHLFSECRDLIFQNGIFQDLRQHRMLGRHDNCGRSEDRVDARGKHADLFIMVFDFEIDVGAFAATNPVALPLQNFLRPTAFDLFNVFNQLLSVLRGAQVPLLNLFLGDRRTATPADAARRLFI